MRTIIDKTFTDEGVSEAISAGHGDTIRYDETGTYSASTWLIERSNNGGATWQAVLEFDANASGTIVVEREGAAERSLFRARVDLLDAGDTDIVLSLKHDTAGSEVVYVDDDALTLSDKHEGKVLITQSEDDTVITVPKNAPRCRVVRGTAAEVSFAAGSGATLESMDDYVYVAGLYGVVELQPVTQTMSLLSGDLKADPA